MCDSHPYTDGGIDFLESVWSSLSRFLSCSILVYLSMKRLDSIWQCLVAFFLTRISTTTATVAWSSLSGPVSPLCHISLGNVWRVIPMSRLELGMYGGVFWRETSQVMQRSDTYMDAGI